MVKLRKTFYIAFKVSKNQSILIFNTAFVLKYQSIYLIPIHFATPSLKEFYDISGWYFYKSGSRGSWPLYLIPRKQKSERSALTFMTKRMNYKKEWT